jgi:threonine/homoserine/homoserine lactone efflux protein
MRCREPPSMTDPLAFLLSVVALLAVPGPTNTLLASAGGLYGVRRAVMLVPAEVAGYLLAIGLIGLVLRPLLAMYPQAATGLRVLAGIVLIALAIRLWRRSDIVLRPDGTHGTPIRAWHVFVTTLLNPKAAVFALGIIPHLGGSTPRLALPYVAGFVALLVVIASGWAMLGAQLQGRERPRVRPMLIRRGGAVVLMVFATALLGSAMWATA